MVEEKTIRLSQAARELNVGVSTLTEHLAAQGVKDVTTNSKITLSQLEKIGKELGLDVSDISLIVAQKKVEVKEPQLTNTEIANKDKKEEPASQDNNTVDNTITSIANDKSQESDTQKSDHRNKLQGIKIIGKIDLDKGKENKKEKSTKTEEPKQTTKQENKKVVETDLGQNRKEEKTTAKKEVKEEVKPLQTKEKEEVKPIAQKDKKEEKALPKEEVVAEIKKEEKNAVLIENIVQDTIKEPVVEKEPELIKAQAELLPGLKVLGKIVLPTKGNRPVASSDDKIAKKKRKRKKKPRQDENNTGTNTNNNSTVQNKDAGQTQNNNNQSQTNQNRSTVQNKTTGNTNSTNNNTNNNTGNNNNQNRTYNNNNGNNNNQNRTYNNNNNQNRNTSNFNNKTKPNTDPIVKEEISAKQVDEKLKETLAKMSGNSPKKKSFKKIKNHHDNQQDDSDDGKTLKVTEFISANDLATMMNVSVNQVISVCLNLGMFVSINQRLDAEAITFIADEFGFAVDFTTVEVENKVEEEEDDDKDSDLLQDRAPIVTIMGHVDHGKTSLLDYIRQTNVTSQESGGITQHIGAYEVVTATGKKITFLDTPGHEAFTAMRARGAKITDVVILVVAADDNVMPQTKEAINHAKLAGVPIVIAINKVDKPTADPERIKQELAQENVLVESWGGKYQDEAISAKTGIGIPELLEKVLLEAELLELKANPDRKAKGTVIEASLDKGRGYVTNVLVQSGTLRVGDIILAGSHYGRVKAMHDHRGLRVEVAGPSTPVQVLGLNGAPQAGDLVKVVGTEREAREITAKREQILREQSIRTRKGLTLGDIGRRIALGNFQELKIIVKGDVDGSVEALSDSLLKLSTEEIEVKIIHKAVGQISESDVLLASAFEAIIIGFQVRPSTKAKFLADQEKVEIKLYSVIYDSINDVRDAMEGMLAPKIEEKVVGNIEIREVFKISKIGTVAGCYVTEGYVKRNNKIRLIRDGIVIFDGELDALKRFKDDVSEVKFGFECGASIKNFNDIKVGDIIESYEQRETKRTLA